MIKQFPKKLIREKKYPRCHYTKKRGKIKPKKPYDSLQAAEEFIKKHHLVNYKAYLCPYCNKWHIGFVKE